MIEPWMVAAGMGAILALVIWCMRQKEPPPEKDFDEGFKDWAKKVEEREPD